MRSTFDAIVIGGGPAGSLAAFLLAQQGWHVAIIERKPRHRHKTCGHCLSSRALPLLASVGLLDAVRKKSTGRTSRVRLHAMGKAVLDLTFATDREGLLVERNTFDQLLLDHAQMHGAEVHQPARWSPHHGGRLRQIVVTHSETRSTLAAPLILGADGLGSGVARWLGASPSTCGRKFGFAFDLQERSQTNGVIDMHVSPGGYLGRVTNEVGATHVAGLVGSAAHGGQREPFAFCSALAARAPELQSLGLQHKTRAGAHNFTAAGPMPWRPRRIAGADFALLGDAAGYIEPFTGEGITWALQSAALLAASTCEINPGQWSVDCAVQYESRWRHRIGREQQRCAFIAWWLERPWMMAAAAQLAPHSLSARLARRIMEE